MRFLISGEERGRGDRGKNPRPAIDAFDGDVRARGDIRGGFRRGKLSKGVPVVCGRKNGPAASLREGSSLANAVWDSDRERHSHSLPLYLPLPDRLVQNRWPIVDFVSGWPILTKQIACPRRLTVANARSSFTMNLAFHGKRQRARLAETMVPVAIDGVFGLWARRANLTCQGN